MGGCSPAATSRGARRSLPLARRVEETKRRLIRGGVRGGERRGVVTLLGDGGVETVRAAVIERDGGRAFWRHPRVRRRAASGRSALAQSAAAAG